MSTLFSPRSAPSRLVPSMRAALAPPGALMLPFLMLPLLASSLWVLMRAPDAVHDARLLAAIAAAVLAWYLLGGALVLLRLRAGRDARVALAGRRAALEAMPGQVWATDDCGLVLWQNDAALAAHGDRLGRNVAGALARLTADPDQVAASLAARSEGRGKAEAMIASGRLRLTHAGPTLRVWGYLATQPTASPAPTDAGDASGNLFERIPVALLRIDRDGLITAANGAARAILGDAQIGGTLSSILDGLGRPVDHWVDDVLHNRTEPRPELLHRRGRGSDVHLQVSLAHDGGDGLIAMLTDASAMKTLEAQFVQSQKMQAIGQLAGGIAHDFNNLLTAISGHCDLLMLRHDQADPDYADLDQIGQNANRAAALVGQLLAFSRKQTLKPQIMDLRETLADLTHLLNRLVSERVVLELEHASDLNPIRADRRQVEQVIVNLVVNARDAMPDGGRITMRTRNLGRDASFRPDRLPAGDWVEVTVGDEGCGIAGDKLDKIFEPFFTTKRTGEGTGLGLSTVYGIVKQTGGFVFCDSTPGVGTTFSLYFPAHDRADLDRPLPERKEGVAAPPLGARVRGGTVLLVEDEGAVRAFAARALRMRGLEVVEAESAEAALDFLADARKRVDVFVTDVVMPGMDGPSWVRTALRDRPDTRVVFISGYTEDIFENDRAPIPGAVFVQKPFSLASFATTVSDLVATGTPAADGEAAAMREAGARRHAPDRAQ